jgi:hypothetical protein
MNAAGRYSVRRSRNAALRSNALRHERSIVFRRFAYRRLCVTRTLEKLVAKPGFTGRTPGGPSRWSTERSGECQPLETELVVEVQYAHFSGGRWRFSTHVWPRERKGCADRQNEAGPR